MTSNGTYLWMIFSLIFIAAIVLKPSTSILCYECNSHTNKNCSLKIPPNNTIVDCTAKSRTGQHEYTMCRKIHQTIDFEVNGLPPDNRVIRSCAWEDSQYKDACYSRSGFGGRQDACTCSKDLCNSSLPTSKMTANNIVIVYCLTLLSIILAVNTDALI